MADPPVQQSQADPPVQHHRSQSVSYNTSPKTTFGVTVLPLGPLLPCWWAGGVGQGYANIRLLSQHLFCYWVLHRNSESSSSDLKAV